MRNKVNKVGLLGTETTIKSKLYADVLTNVQVYTLNEAGQKATTKIIMDILAGKKLSEDRAKLMGYIQKLKEFGAEKVILGCTELPLLIRENDDVFDTLEILAKSTVKRATK